MAYIDDRRELLIEHMANEFPFLVREMVECYTDGYDELVVTLSDGGIVSYDDFYKTFRRLPSDYNMNEDECKMEFGIRLRKTMALKGLNQTMLSERTGIPQPLLSNYITGRTNPSFYAVDKIAKALGCSVDEFRHIER